MAEALGIESRGKGGSPAAQGLELASEPPGRKGVAPDGWRPLARLESSDRSGRKGGVSRPSGKPLGRDFRLAVGIPTGRGRRVVPRKHPPPADDPVPLGAGFRFGGGCDARRGRPWPALMGHDAAIA